MNSRHTDDTWEVAILPQTGGDKAFFGNDGFPRPVIEVSDNEFAFWWKVGDLRQFHSPFAWSILTLVMGTLGFALAYSYPHRNELARLPVEEAIGEMVFAASPVAIVAGILVFYLIEYLNRRTKKHIWQARKLFLVELGYKACPEMVSTPHLVSGDTTHVIVPRGVSNPSELEAYLATHHLN